MLYDLFENKKNEGMIFMDKLDSLVLELFSRVKSLEEKVEMLETKLSDSTDINDQEIEEDYIDGDQKKITRSVARKYVIEQIRNSNSSIEVKIAKRNDVGDLILTNNMNSLDVKFYYSKSHIKEHVSSWHTVKKDEIFNNAINLHIFTVSYDGEFHTFIFTKDELQNFVKNKECGSAELYHFYFHKLGNKLLEVRDGEKDVSKYYERWNFVANML